MKMNREHEISVGKNGILNPWKFRTFGLTKGPAGETVPKCKSI